VVRTCVLARCGDNEDWEEEEEEEGDDDDRREMRRTMVVVVVVMVVVMVVVVVMVAVDAEAVNFNYLDVVMVGGGNKQLPWVAAPLMAQRQQLQRLRPPAVLRAEH
jgi:hypothetical protein